MLPPASPIHGKEISMHSSRSRPVWLALLGLVTFALLPSAARAQEPSQTPPPAAPATTPAEPERAKHPFLMYIPNRLFDVLDMVRLRARVGPGFALSARATEAVDATLGGYTSLYVGLPGPRGKPRIPWPFGIENFAGVEVSVVGAGDEDRFEPGYGALEVGAGTQLLLLGVDVGVDPLEVVDLALGFLTIDIGKDDY
jgi:hypothetical protein